MRKLAATAALAGCLLALAACGSSAPNADDVKACNGLKQAIVQMSSRATVGSAGTQDELTLMMWQAVAHDSRLKSDVRSLEQALLLANPAAGDYSQLGYDSEDAAVKEIGLFCAGDGVSDIADGW